VLAFFGRLTINQVAGRQVGYTNSNPYKYNKRSYRLLLIVLVSFPYGTQDKDREAKIQNPLYKMDYLCHTPSIWCVSILLIKVGIAVLILFRISVSYKE
jgi:uncharacterized membrane protein